MIVGDFKPQGPCMYPPPSVGKKIMHNKDVLQKIDSEQYCVKYQALEQEVGFLV